MIRNLLCALSAVSLAAQTLAPPVAGVVVNGQGRLVTVRGVLGNLLPGTPVALPPDVNDQRLLGTAFCGAIGAIKISTEVLVMRGDGTVEARVPAPDGPALFSFDAQATSLQWIYFETTGHLQNASGSVAFDASAMGDAVVALGVIDGVSGAATAVPVLALTGSQLWAEIVSASTGAVLTRIAISGTPPGVFFEGGWLVKSDHGLTWQPASIGPASRQIEIPEPVRTLQTSGMHSAAVNGQWMVNGNWQLLEIPAASDAPAPRRREQTQ